MPSRASDQLSYSEHLVAHLERFRTMPLSDTILEKVRMCLLDHLAAVFSAAGSPVAAVGSRLVASFGTGPCTLIGTPRTSSIMGAAFYNGLVATSEDLDDAHRYASGLHMSATTFPALFALVDRDEKIPVNGERLIQAILSGYEVSSRIVRAADAGIRERGYHSTGAAGIFGACAGAGVLLGLSTKSLVNALGIAASGGGGLFAFLHEGSSVRHAHGAWASANGLGAALLAEAGMTGPRLALEGYGEGKDGWLHAYAGHWDESFILEASDRPELMNAYHKMHATCGHAAPGITALQQLRERVLPRTNELISIVIKGYNASAALNNPDPKTISEAKFSLPFITGVILRHGRATLQEMVPATLDDPEVRRIASLVRVEEDPGIAAAFPKLRACEVVVSFANGDTLNQRVDAPLGMPENPVSLEVIENKFRDATDGVLPPERRAQVLALVRQLESLDSARTLTRLLRTA